MTNCNREPIRFPRCKGRLVEAAFTGGDITSNGGAVLLRQANRRLGLTGKTAAALTDPRRARGKNRLKSIHSCNIRAKAKQEYEKFAERRRAFLESEGERTDTESLEAAAKLLEKRPKD